MNSATKPTPAAQANVEDTPSIATVEQDVEAMRVADFNFIYVFRRKDGGVMDADDKRFVNVITPPQINRKKLSDSGKAIILGSNFRMPPDVLKQLTDRFAFEDISKPESEIIGTTNAITNK